MPRADQPVCSVCIANFNGVGMLRGCIESVLRQAGSIPIEILVHDDASTDDSVSWLRSHYPAIEVLASPENVGFCVANNRLVARSSGDYVLLLNNDAELFPDSLQALLATAPAFEGILTLPQYDWATNVIVDRGCLLDFFYNPVPNDDPSRAEVAMAIGACLFLPRTLWIELGGFPDWLGSLAEDMYLCCLARLRGYSVECLPASGYRHRQGASFGGNRPGSAGLESTYRRRALSERNKTSVLIICTPTGLVWPLLVLHLLELAIEGTILALFRRDWRIWYEIYKPALGHVVANGGRLFQMRKRAQQSRRTTLRGYLGPFVAFPRKVALLWRHGLPVVR